MTRSLGLLLILSMFGFAADSVPEPDESQEPQLKYEIKIDDKSVIIGEHESTEIEGTFTNPKVTITPQSERIFPYQGITFKYPRSFTYEADLKDPDAKIWTLSGNDFIIMVLSLNGQHSTAEYADTMLDIFGRDRSEVTNDSAEIKLGSETLHGTRLQVTLAGSKLVMDIYEIPSRGSRTKFLVFQDSLDDEGNPSKEGEAVIAGLNASFQITQ